jgi:hypothetical protein
MKEEIRVERTVAPVPSFTWRVSWGAIIAGLFVTIVIQITLTMLGAAIGLASIEPLREQHPAQGLGFASGVWLLVSGLVSIWIGACIAGRLCGSPARSDGLIHGIVTWSVSTCVMLFLMASAAGAFLGGTGALLSGALAVGGSLTGQHNPQAAVSEQIKAMFSQTGALLPPTGRTEGSQPPGKLTELAQQDAELAAALARMESQGAAKSEAERDRVVSLLTSKHSLDQGQASSLVDQWDQQYQHLSGQAEQKLRQGGEVAAQGLSRAALWGFFALLLGLLVSAWGGWAGAPGLPRYVEETVATT